LTKILYFTPNNPLLSLLLETISLHLPIFCSLALLPELTTALLATYDSLGTTAVGERKLIALLRSISGIERVEDAWKRFIDSLALTSAPAPSLLTPEQLPSITTLLSSLPSTSSSSAGFIDIVSNLYYRYHTHSNWGPLIVIATFKVIVEIGEEKGVGFLRAVGERLGEGLEGVLNGLFFDSSTEGDLMSGTKDMWVGRQGGCIRRVLATLVAAGVVDGAKVVKFIIVPGFIAALHRHSLLTTSTVISSAPDSMNSTGGDGLNSIAQNLAGLLSDLLGNDEPPSLAQSQRLMSRRVGLFKFQPMPEMGRCLALIVRLQERAASSYAAIDGGTDGAGAKNDELSGKKEEMDLSILFSKICRAKEFKMIVKRDPGLLSNAMLDEQLFIDLIRGEGSAMQEKHVRMRTLSGLLFALRDGNDPGSLFSLLILSSLISLSNIRR
jgi:hypothetical protein